MMVKVLPATVTGTRLVVATPSVPFLLIPVIREQISETSALPTKLLPRIKWSSLFQLVQATNESTGTPPQVENIRHCAIGSSVHPAGINFIHGKLLGIVS